MYIKHNYFVHTFYIYPSIPYYLCMCTMQCIYKLYIILQYIFIHYTGYTIHVKCKRYKYIVDICVNCIRYKYIVDGKP